MRNKGYTEYYKMKKETYEQMRKFYLELGYNEQQTEKLCKSCFGAEIRISEDAYNSGRWVFPRRREYPEIEDVEDGEDGAAAPQTKGGFHPLESIANAFRGAGARKKSGAVMRDAGMPAPLPSMPAMMGMSASMSAANMAAVSGGMGMNMAAMNQMMNSEFNTAETEAPKENETHSPMDDSQLIFSANVNTASWAYLSDRIKTGNNVNPDFVRIEEIINSYGYDLKKPKDDELFEITAEGGRCPWNEGAELFFLGIKGKKADADVKHNLALLIDVSGSMADEWILVQMSLAAIMSKLKKGDIVSVIAYSDVTVNVAEKAECGDMDKLVDIILSIDGIGGCTYGSKGLEDAYKLIGENFAEDKNNRVFIFTDGDFNFGVTGKGQLKDFIYDKRKTGIYLSIVGYGMHNFKDDKMETLAQNGNGNYTFVSNPYAIKENLWKKLESNFITVAKDVKISVQFNPKYVSKYRLIGYDARQLTKEEFYDTEKAADGIGSEHEVAALIEFTRGAAEQKYKSRYVDVTTKDSGNEIAYVEIHYKDADGNDLEMTRVITPGELEPGNSGNVRKAALLGGFGLLVKNSEYKGEMNVSMLKELYQTELRAEDIEKPAPYSHLDIIGTYLR